MAKDVITRFKLETTAYDSKLRDATKGLSDYAKTATAAGKEFGKFTQANVEAARAIGNISPSANNAKDKVKELVTAYNELAKAYNQLTKEQQQSDFGKAMADSLGKLKTQIADAKQELYGLGDAMKKAGEGNSGFTSMLAVFGGNLLTKGVSMLTSELVGSVQQSIELAQQGEGVRNAFERLNKPGLLDSLKEATHGTVSELELMKQAVKFDNFKLPLDQMGTLLAFAQQQAKDTGQSVDYMVDSIVTGLGRKSLPILDNLGLSASEIRERMKESGDMTTAVADIIRDRMEAAGGYVETAADRAARATAKAQDAAEAFGRNAIPIAQEWAETWATLSQGAMSFANILLGPVAESIRSIQGILNSDPMDRVTGSKYNLFNGYKNPTPDIGLPNQRVTAPGGYVVVTDKNGKEIGAKHFDDLSGVDAWKAGLSTKSTRIGGGRRGGGSANQQTEFQQNQTKINTLTQEYVKLGDQATDSARKRQEEIQNEIASIEKRNGLLKLREEQAHGKLNDVNVDMSVLSGTPSLDAWWNNRKNSTFTGLTKEGQKAIERQQKNFYKNLGKDGKEEKSFTQVADQMVGGISQMVGGLEKIGIELPEGFQSILSGISGVIEVLQAINIIVEAINAAQTVGAFLGIFAHGGVVPHAQSGLNVVGGTHYSGDVTPILANAGEVVLNNAQVQNLANNLQNGGGQQSIRVYGIMRGKDIVLTSDNYLKSTGKGQFVTTKNRRN